MTIDKSVFDELVEGLLDIAGNTVSSIVLFGSVARGTAEEYSDIDIALITNQPLTVDADDRLTYYNVNMNHKHNKVFSIIDIPDSDYKNSTLPFYRNVCNEGVVLWESS